MLRKAFEDILPEEIVWRKKEQFDEGSGTVDLLTETLKDVMNEQQAQQYQKRASRYKIKISRRVLLSPNIHEGF
nr:asparagine synthase-related protein [Crocosphaera watsonii]